MAKFINYMCPLCQEITSQFYCQDRLRPYLRCLNCSLVYVPSDYHVSLEHEKKRYDLHNNNPNDSRYRQFLGKLLNVLAPLLPAGASGLDYGSGPGPTLSIMFSELNFPMQIFDPFYANDRALLSESYDFLTCTETMEHFRKPREEWELFIKLVKKGGWIGIMTSLLQEHITFSDWYYKNDETHVCFYSKKTFSWLAAKYGLNLHIYGHSVLLFET